MLFRSYSLFTCIYSLLGIYSVTNSFIFSIHQRIDSVIQSFLSIFSLFFSLFLIWYQSKFSEFVSFLCSQTEISVSFVCFFSHSWLPIPQPTLNHKLSIQCQLQMQQSQMNMQIIPSFFLRMKIQVSCLLRSLSLVQITT